ncbi:MAG TPA: CHAT domain-containing protein [Oscillatoriales cyanobacterium M59_W2019_021]|nr:CHAT domain-containing protein [Oscillatoriales cyanobacterium M4454_W2019_049]HIK52866.1 CHAT domain-containing protein [Oscillatoriales cyanobacterium M59_W2019_021]
MIDLSRQKLSRWMRSQFGDRGFRLFVRLTGLAALAALLVGVGIPAMATSDLLASDPPAVRSFDADSILQQGKQAYQAGRLAEAAALWQQAAEAYQQSGDTFNQVRALNYLSVVARDLGEWENAQVAIERSLDLLHNQPQLDTRGTILLAQALNHRGSWELAMGQSEAALSTWQQAEAAYDRAGNEIGKLGSQINQAQALQALGQYRRSRAILTRMTQDLQSQPDSTLKADGLRSLGRALQTVGNLLEAKAVLEQSWAISGRLGITTDTGATLLNLGNIARELQQYDVALDYYREAAARGGTEMAIAQAELNEFSLSIATGAFERTFALVSPLQSRLSQLQPSRDAIYARVNFAASLMQLPENPNNNPRLLKLAAEQLATAVGDARQLRDSRAEASALTELGKLYIQTQQWQEGKAATEKALQIAQAIDADDAIARSASQLGYVLAKGGDRAAALAAYATSFESLQSLRGDTIAISSDVQFAFKDSIEPIYREYTSLLLQAGATQAELKQARDVIEALQLVELDNFFQEACLETRPVQIDTIDPHAAVLHPIILNDRLEVILSLPDGSLQHYSTSLPSDRVENILQQLSSAIYLGYSKDKHQPVAQQVYDWLIRPAKTELENQQVKTLVFVLDGFLRNLPMGVLYDGRQYLVEQYGIALSPGLQLFPEALEKSQLKTLAVGLTEARQGFTALPGVAVELEKIAEEVDAQVSINRQFTRERFQEQLDAKDFGIVHLATHGQFSSNPEETFLLTWEDKIKVHDFDRLFNSPERSDRPVELLVLSACQTAAGDRRAALGLAGFALRSGARSTLATLWSVSDRSTADLMATFYDRLVRSDAKLSKAESLRQAQIQLLKDPRYNHPFFWAPFVLVGNWL